MEVTMCQEMMYRLLQGAIHCNCIPPTSKLVTFSEMNDNLPALQHETGPVRLRLTFTDS